MGALMPDDCAELREAQRNGIRVQYCSGGKWYDGVWAFSLNRDSYRIHPEDVHKMNGKTPDKYARIRKALAEGKRVEFFDHLGHWIPCHYPQFDDSLDVDRYRIVEHEETVEQLRATIADLRAKLRHQEAAAVPPTVKGPFLVFGPQGGAPQVQHADRELAILEAERLAVKHVGQAMVLALVATVEARVTVSRKFND